MKLRAFTWNVCGLELESLGPAADASLVSCLAESLAGADADIVTCGLVEVVDLTPTNVVRDSLVAQFFARAVLSFLQRPGHVLGGRGDAAAATWIVCVATRDG
mmetsp:Transcript_21813/g.67149  ORF Transcript_21813/g.67149 Transcript_21813/m.67149 type:complete len:103 (-) Transcript_21813:1288-1596(-)